MKEIGVVDLPLVNKLLLKYRITLSEELEEKLANVELAI